MNDQVSPYGPDVRLNEADLIHAYRNVTPAGKRARVTALARERNRRRRERYKAAGLTASGTVPIPQRRVVSWNRIQHMPERRPGDPRLCRWCARKVGVLSGDRVRHRGYVR